MLKYIKYGPPFRNANKIYLRDFIYGGIDGTITTFAVVSGVTGGQLSTIVILILGFANLIADGFSMAVSNYLGTKAEIEQQLLDSKENIQIRSAFKASLFTFCAFLFFGFVPLLPYVFSFQNAFFLSIIMTGCVFFIIGSIKSFWSFKSWIYSALETVAIGSTAAFLAYLVGWILRKFIAT